MAAEKRFREDLLYRLNVVVLTVPPLRLRSEDIPDLVQHLLARFDAAELGGSPPEVSPSALAALIRHSWPGNVRELHNELLRAAALSDGRVTRELLSPNLQRGAAPAVGSESLGAAVAAAEKAAILLSGKLPAVSNAQLARLDRALALALRQHRAEEGAAAYRSSYVRPGAAGWPTAPPGPASPT
jgi:DNA-binding NtrC family response regulator